MIFSLEQRAVTASLKPAARLIIFMAVQPDARLTPNSNQLQHAVPQCTGQSAFKINDFWLPIDKN